MTRALAFGFVTSIYFRALGMVDPWVPLVWFVAWGVAWLLSEANTERKLKIVGRASADAITEADNDSCRCK